MAARSPLHSPPPLVRPPPPAPNEPLFSQPTPRAWALASTTTRWRRSWAPKWWSWTRKRAPWCPRRRWPPHKATSSRPTARKACFHRRRPPASSATRPRRGVSCKTTPACWATSLRGCWGRRSVRPQRRRSPSPGSCPRFRRWPPCRPFSPRPSLPLMVSYVKKCFCVFLF